MHPRHYKDTWYLTIKDRCI
uniref:Uncharacterized protein n=1 Tax=Rhizophora mucronata TaxID=61149 RepID=A0A2P2NCP5_RHIMU